MRTLLAKFGLRAAHVLRPAGTLSPGERTRAALALLQARGVNLLVLDEPTNHLDLPAIEQLESALAGYPGTLLLVTHDRRMLDAVHTTRHLRGRRRQGHRLTVDAARSAGPRCRSGPGRSGSRCAGRRARSTFAAVAAGGDQRRGRAVDPVERPARPASPRAGLPVELDRPGRRPAARRPAAGAAGGSAGSWAISGQQRRASA